MPTRYLKPGIRDSAAIDMLSPMAETLFTRLLVTVDDFGRTDARPAMVKAHCYPIKATATEAICEDLMRELVACGLAVVYAVDGKPILQLAKWDNVPRSKSSKFPEMHEGCAHLYTSANGCKVNANLVRIQVQTDAPVTGTGTGTGTVTSTGTETDKGEAKKPPKRFDASAIELPAWLDAGAWALWVKDRSKRGKPVTETAARLQIKQLGEYLAAGHLPESVIEHSIAGGYQGLFPPRMAGMHGGTSESFEERDERNARNRVDRLINGEDDHPPGPDIFDTP